MPFVKNSEVLKHSSFNICFWACSIHICFKILDSNTRVEPDMLLTFVIVVAEGGGAVYISKQIRYIDLSSTQACCLGATATRYIIPVLCGPSYNHW